MKLSELFTKTLREVPTDEEAINAKLLIQGGFVSKVMAGVFEYLPLGFRVLSKINNIIREEMNNINAQEIFMSGLQNKETWKATDRWDKVSEVMYQFKDNSKKDIGLAFTHEEPITITAKHFINSYKDLPKAVYQIHTTFRDEPRAKSGLLRGKEFIMKDLYSFHTDEKSLDDYYEKVIKSYQKIFDRTGVKAIRTRASGGIFSEQGSDEFQVVSEIGEDTIYVNEKENRAINHEVYNDFIHELGWKKEDLIEKKSIEIANIFKLRTRFSEPLSLFYTDKEGKKKPVVMASYGIGPGRLMGTIIEIHHDNKGIIWPESVAPYKIHLISLDGKNKAVSPKAGKPYQKQEADNLYNRIKNQIGDEVLYDDREDKTPGEKFADADLIGCPIRLVVSKKTSVKNSVEIKHRNKKEVNLIPLSKIFSII